MIHASHNILLSHSANGMSFGVFSRSFPCQCVFSVKKMFASKFKVNKGNEEKKKKAREGKRGLNKESEQHAK